MNLLFSCIGKRGYIADYFREALGSEAQLFGTSSTPWTPGFASCDRSFLLPPYKSDDYKGAVLQLIRENRVNGLFSFMDEDVAILASIRDEILAAGCVPLVPPKRVAEMCLDKWEAYRFFESHGLRTPRTYIDLAACSAALEAGQISFPLFIKPRSGFGSSNSFLVNNKRELEVLFHYAPDMMIQEHIDAEWFNVDLLCDLEGRLISVVPWRKLRSRLGETEQAITVDHPPVMTFVQKLLEALNGHIGPMDVDLYVKNGEVGVLEMNPRFGGGYPVTHHAGGGFPELIVRMLRGEKVNPCMGDYRRDAMMMKVLKPFGGPRTEVSERVLKLRKDVAEAAL